MNYLCKKFYIFLSWLKPLVNNMDDKRNSETEKITCTMCGKQFDKWDMSLGDNRYDIFVNYPSKYDLKRLRFDFCCSCFDKVLDTIIDKED